MCFCCYLSSANTRILMDQLWCNERAYILSTTRGRNCIILNTVEESQCVDKEFYRIALGTNMILNGLSWKMNLDDVTFQRQDKFSTACRFHFHVENLVLFSTLHRNVNVHDPLEFLYKFQHENIIFRVPAWI